MNEEREGEFTVSRDESGRYVGYFRVESEGERRIARLSISGDIAEAFIGKYGAPLESAWGLKTSVALRDPREGEFPENEKPGWKVGEIKSLEDIRVIDPPNVHFVDETYPRNDYRNS